MIALEPAWWDLWHRCPGATPFQSPAWLIPWWQVFHPGELRLYQTWRGGKLDGLAALYIESGRLRPVGVSLSDYCDILVAGDPAALMAQILADPDWRDWDMPDLAENATAWGLPLPSICEEERADADPVAVLSLPPAIPKTQRRKLRMAQNRAARRGGYEFFTTPDLGEVFRLNAQRWPESDRRIHAFLRLAAPRLHQAGLLRLYGLRIGGAFAGGYFGLLHGKRAYAYLSGFDPAFVFESPGALFLAHAISQAQAEGAEVFDFLRGAEAYKFAWGAEQRINRRRLIRRVQVNAYRLREAGPWSVLPARCLRRSDLRHRFLLLYLPIRPGSGASSRGAAGFSTKWDFCHNQLGLWCRCHPRTRRDLRLRKRGAGCGN